VEGVARQGEGRVGRKRTTAIGCKGVGKGKREKKKTAARKRKANEDWLRFFLKRLTIVAEEADNGITKVHFKGLLPQKGKRRFAYVNSSRHACG